MRPKLILGFQFLFCKGEVEDFLYLWLIRASFAAWGEQVIQLAGPSHDILNEVALVSSGAPLSSFSDHPAWIVLNQRLLSTE